MCTQGMHAQKELRVYAIVATKVAFYYLSVVFTSYEKMRQMRQVIKAGSNGFDV